MQSGLLELLQIYEKPTQAADTVQFKTISHEQLTQAFNTFVFHHSGGLGIEGSGDNLQSLRDGGVDSVWRANTMRFGFQVKSWGDINDKQDSFRRIVLSQIAESRQMGLACLMIAFAADLTNNSQSQKARQLMAEIERMQDRYAFAISPEKTLAVWNWMQRTNLSALEQNRSAGYAALTVVTDSLGNRSETSAVQGRYSNGSLATTVRAGDAVHFTARAEAENCEMFEFQFDVQRSGGCFETSQHWSISPRWTWRIAVEDIGRNVFVKVATRRPKGYYQFADADDYVTFLYDVLPPHQ